MNEEQAAADAARAEVVASGGAAGDAVVSDTVVSDAVVSDAVVSDAVVSDAAKPAQASGKRGLVIALVISLLAFVAAGSFAAYLWLVHEQWVEQNTELRAVAETLGTDVAEARAQAEQVQADLDETTEQLQEAKDTINGLADSEAQAGDDRQALVDVAKSLQECADARKELVGYLKESHLWTAASLRASENNINEFCNDVARTYREIVKD